LKKNNPVHRKTKRYTKQTKKLLTVDDAREIVMKIKKLEGLTKNSLLNYEKLFNDYDRFFGEKTDISSLTSQDATNFIHWQLHKKIQFQNVKNGRYKKIGVSIGSANTFINYSKAAFSVLVNESIVQENIFQNVQRIKEKERKIDVLTVDEVKTLLKSLDKALYSEFRLYTCIHLLLDSFGRIQEICSLKHSDVNFEGRVITFTDTKNGKIRRVPISKRTIKLIEEMIEENAEFDSEYIFLTNHGKPLRPDTFRKHLKEVTERLGFKKRIHPHLFRHSASEMFLKQNGSVRVLQSILGHHSLDVTMRYAHILDETIKEQHDLFSPLKLIDEIEKRKTKRKGKVSH
jgi:integrase/recombinase XerD